jgi:hypothetical protein
MKTLIAISSAFLLGCMMEEHQIEVDDNSLENIEQLETSEASNIVFVAAKQFYTY